MPGFDGTGPMGGGPMTGGRRGLCGAGRTSALPYGGFGYGRGMGAKRGFTGRNRAGYPFFEDQPNFDPGFSANPSNEITQLKEQTSQMTNALQAITLRLDALLKKTPEPS